MLDLDDQDEDERLRERGQGVTDVERAGDRLVGDELPSLKSDVVVANEPTPSVSKKSVNDADEQLLRSRPGQSWPRM